MPEAGKPSDGENAIRLPEDTGLVERLAVSPAESGRTLLQLLDAKPMLLIFLRHFGCMSTRESLASLAKALPPLERRGVRPVVVHMAAPARATQFLHRFRLDGVERVSDPERRLYEAPEFHLLKTSGVQSFTAPENYWKLATRALLRYGLGPARGSEDATQLPGVFYLEDRAIHRAFRHKKISDRVDFARFGV